MCPMCRVLLISFRASLCLYHVTPMVWTGVGISGCLASVLLAQDRKWSQDRSHPRSSLSKAKLKGDTVTRGNFLEYLLLKGGARRWPLHSRTGGHPEPCPPADMEQNRDINGEFPCPRSRSSCCITRGGGASTCVW